MDNEQDNNLEEVLLSLGVKILKKLPYPTDVDLVGVLNGFFIYPYDEKLVVTGRIPLSLAEDFFQSKYRLQLMPCGDDGDFEPIELAKSDTYKNFMDEYLSKNDIFEDTVKHNNVLKNKKQELLEKHKDDFYIDKYIVDGIDAFKFFIERIRENNIINNIELM